MSDEVPRSANMQRWIPEEHRIHEALVAIEALGAHPLLTDAVSKLSDAQRAIAQWHDSGRPGAADNCEHGIPRRFCTALHAPPQNGEGPK